MTKQKNIKNFIKLTLLFFIGITIIISCDKQDDLKSISSNEVTKNVVIEIAQNFLKHDDLTHKDSDITKTIKDITIHKTNKNENAFYVINYNQGGFIVIPADNRISPILAFSESDHFSSNLSQIPEPVNYWMNNLKEQVQYIIENNLSQNKNVALEWIKATNENINSTSKKSLTNITGRIDPDPIVCTDMHIVKGPLLTTKWDQWITYNNMLYDHPCANNGHNGGIIPTGCVATAMAQVMRYFHKPNTIYNWANMPINYGNYDIQLLMKNIGTAVDMVYGCDASGAYSEKIAPAFINNFGYTKASYTTTYNTSIITLQLDSNKPVILSGKNSNSSTGHTWVCDGYMADTYYDRDNLGNCTGSGFSTLYLHMNWGWSGSEDGYYAYNNFNSNGTNYNSNISIVYNFTL